VDFRVVCSGGTYVRALVNDVAKELGSVAHVTALERTKQGIFGLEDCLPFDRWTYDNIADALASFQS